MYFLDNRCILRIPCRCSYPPDIWYILMYRQLLKQIFRNYLIRVYTVCYSVCIFRAHYSIVKLHVSNFQINKHCIYVLCVHSFRTFTFIELFKNTSNRARWPTLCLQLPWVPCIVWLYCVSKQWWLWWDCKDAQGDLSLHIYDKHIYDKHPFQRADSIEL